MQAFPSSQRQPDCSQVGCSDFPKRWNNVFYHCMEFLQSFVSGRHCIYISKDRVEFSTTLFRKLVPNVRVATSILRVTIGSHRRSAQTPKAFRVPSGFVSFLFSIDNKLTISLRKFANFGPVYKVSQFPRI